jgi:uncharacterized membrane protein YraQ (UPF0718 family)
MDTSTIVMLLAAAVTLVVVYWKSPTAASQGLNATGALILEIIPRMVAAFTLAGLIQAVVPQETIVQWMGHGSGMRGDTYRDDVGKRDAGRAHDSFSHRCISF